MRQVGQVLQLNLPAAVSGPLTGDSKRLQSRGNDLPVGFLATGGLDHILGPRAVGIDRLVIERQLTHALNLRSSD